MLLLGKICSKRLNREEREAFQGPDVESSIGWRVGQIIQGMKELVF